jgi:hypothetical protein
MEDTATVTLVKPVTLGELEYSELKLSEPTAEQLVAAEKVAGATASLVELIHLNAAIPRKVAGQLRQRDLQAAAGFFARFGETSPASETSSPS